MPKPKKRTIYIFLIALVTLYIVIEIVPFLTGALTRTEILSYGQLTVEQEVVCYIVRDETVYSAPASGNLKFKFEEGELIKKGSTVLSFDKDSAQESEEEDPLKDSDYKELIERLGSSMVEEISFAAASRGIFSTHVDGYEAVFTPDRLKDLTRRDVDGMSIQGMDVLRKHAIKGEPVYKITDSTVWYMVFWVKKDESGKFIEDASVTVKLSDGEVKATVDQLAVEEDQVKVILKTNRYYKSFASTRKTQATVLMIDQRGLLVSNSSLTTKDGATGVYIKNTIGEYVFKPVRAIATDGEKTLVLEDVYYDDEGQPVDTVNVYDEVLKKPEANQ